MLLERQVGGQVGKRLQVERAFRAANKGEFKPFYQIAAELYDEFRTGALVRREIEARFGVEVSEKTASLWINRGLAERRAELARQQQAEAERSLLPAGVAA